MMLNVLHWPSAYPDPSRNQPFNCIFVEEHVKSLLAYTNNRVLFVSPETTLSNMIKEISKATSQANYGPNRNGDIMFSLADIEHAKKMLNYSPDTNLTKQMESTINDYKLRYY